MAAVEFALLFPAAVVLALGLIETGSMLHSWLAVNKAAQVGARFAATGQGVEQGDRLERIRETALRATSGIPRETVTVSVRSWPDLDANGDGVDSDPGAPCDLVEVAVACDHAPSIPVISAFLPESIRISGRERKRNEPWKPCRSPGNR